MVPQPLGTTYQCTTPFHSYCELYCSAICELHRIVGVYPLRSDTKAARVVFLDRLAQVRGWLA